MAKLGITRTLDVRFPDELYLFMGTDVLELLGRNIMGPSASGVERGVVEGGASSWMGGGIDPPEFVRLRGNTLSSKLIFRTLSTTPATGLDPRFTSLRCVFGDGTSADILRLCGLGVRLKVKSMLGLLLEPCRPPPTTRGREVVVRENGGTWFASASLRQRLLVAAL